MRFTGNGITNCCPDQVDNLISITVLGQCQHPLGMQVALVQGVDEVQEVLSLEPFPPMTSAPAPVVAWNHILIPATLLSHSVETELAISKGLSPHWIHMANEGISDTVPLVTAVRGRS